MTNYTKLQDYTTEELRAELKRRSDLAKAEKKQSEALPNVQALGQCGLFVERIEQQKIWMA